MSKKTGLVCLRITLFTVLGFVGCRDAPKSSGDSSNPIDPGKSAYSPIPATTTSLQATADCSLGQIVVTNTGSDLWTDVKIEVNSKFTHVANTIGAGSTLRFAPSIFTDGSGARFDLDRYRCQSIDLHATTPTGRRDWKRTYK